jgi:hypothetical protein
MTSTTLSPLQLHRTFCVMQQHGGGFCSQLAAAWFIADSSNRARIEAAFPHLLADFGPGSRFFNEVSQ